MLLNRTSQSFFRCAHKRFLSSVAHKLLAPPMVYISGEEMTKYCMDLIRAQWIDPLVDTSQWQYFDLSVKSRDATDDKVLKDAVAAGKVVGAIFKEPTVTPTAEQAKKLGLKKAWGSPNGAMRKGWNGITISRDTIHIDGMELGFRRPVLFERHAVGGEYGAGWAAVGQGTLRTIFTPTGGGAPITVDERVLKDRSSVVVTYDNPLDNVEDLSHIFFARCLTAKVTPYVVTKKTVFKWQEGFWKCMKTVFDQHYKKQFNDAGLLANTRGELQHLISDAATMQLIRWTGGGFGMACHNYDGDMLTDEVAQIHRSPGFITSSLIGKREDGSLIKEFEASHGTVADMWEAHLRGEETSLNPLGLVEALIGAMQHSAALQGAARGDNTAIIEFTNKLRAVIHRCMVAGLGTRDLCGPSGLTTEQFVSLVRDTLARADGVPQKPCAPKPCSTTPTASPVTTPAPLKETDEAQIRALFNDLDADGNGSIDFLEFSQGLQRLGVTPKSFGFSS
eukprot:gnl/Spiro4/22200_TR10933_c0_g1_i1.p1 gnl/Spiro4/22200_TR10933_c0_g1~~gnl/Spiro4/22200_TR10933_c0_g1_i1.p1  ORF type:complete len:506 (+),score=157.29 gnl/Spiro4/22200_TR10933_c0_g1_i1:56-1573(+)